MARMIESRLAITSSERIKSQTNCWCWSQCCFASANKPNSLIANTAKLRNCKKHIREHNSSFFRFRSFACWCRTKDAIYPGLIRRRSLLLVTRLANPMRLITILLVALATASFLFVCYHADDVGKFVKVGQQLKLSSKTKERLRLNFFVINFFKADQRGCFKLFLKYCFKNLILIENF